MLEVCSREGYRDGKLQVYRGQPVEDVERGNERDSVDEDDRQKLLGVKVEEPVSLKGCRLGGQSWIARTMEGLGLALIDERLTVLTLCSFSCLGLALQNVDLNPVYSVTKLVSREMLFSRWDSRVTQEMSR